MPPAGLRPQWRVVDRDPVDDPVGVPQAAGARVRPDVRADGDQVDDPGGQPGLLGELADDGGGRVLTLPYAAAGDLPPAGHSGPRRGADHQQPPGGVVAQAVRPDPPLPARCPFRQAGPPRQTSRAAPTASAVTSVSSADGIAARSVGANQRASDVDPPMSATIGRVGRSTATS